MGWREKGPPPCRKIELACEFGSVWNKVLWHGRDDRRSCRRHAKLLNELRRWDEQFSRLSRRWTMKTLAWNYRKNKPKSWKNYRDHQ